MKPRILRIFWICSLAPIAALQKLWAVPLLIRKIRVIRGSSSLKSSQNPLCGLKSPTLLACLALVSCSWLGLGKKKPAPEPPAPTATLVGRIASIPADHRFVLIQSYGKWSVATGTVLIARGADTRTANLLATGEALGQFAAADVQSGTLEVGDAVFLPAPLSHKKPPTPQELPKTSPPAPTVKTP